MVDTRALAADILIEVNEHGEYLSGILSDVLYKYSWLDKRDRAFLSRLCIGTVERRLEIDSVIDAYSKTPVKKQKPYIRNILRLSVYQILYMDSVPDRAAVNEAVKMARKKGFSGLSGFVNGVLRSISKDNSEGEVRGRITSLPEDAGTKELSLYFSMPEWIVEEYIKVLGRDQAIAALASFYERAGEITLHVNTQKNTPEEFAALLEKDGVKAKQSPIPDIITVSGADKTEAIPGYDEGRFFVQDLSSASAVKMAGIEPGMEVLDVCAAPGGKSFAAVLCGGNVRARDVSEKKRALIEENAKRLGFSGISTEVFDATKRDGESENKYDIVLCDVPCSGLGVLSKKPELKYRVVPSDMEKLADKSVIILKNAVSYLKKGGKLLFSTCTVSSIENEGTVDHILEEEKELSLIETKTFAPSGNSDGFFAAVFIRK